MSKHQKVIVRCIVNASGEVLMVLRNKEASRPLEWEFPGGKVDWGEAVDSAVERELSEETGIDLHDKKLILTWSSVSKLDSDVHFIGLLYESKLKSKPKVTLSNEHQDYQWVNKKTWSGLELEPEYKEFFSSYFDTVSPSSKPTGDEVIMYSDGGSRGNPGPSATGWVLFEPDEKTEIARGGEYLGITTNNQAEYIAVRQGIEKAKELGVKNLACRIDSMLVVKQMSGEYKIKNKDLWPIHQSIKDLVNHFESVTFTHVYRENNTVADTIVNEVLDKHEDQLG